MKAISSELMERFDAEELDFLSRIVTGDETWAHHYEPETKGSQWSGIIRNHQEKRISRQLLPPESS